MKPLNLRDRIQELQELGAKGVLFRISWEAGRRAGRFDRPIVLPLRRGNADFGARLARLFTLGDVRHDPALHTGWVQDQGLLATQALSSVNGRLLCYGRWAVDCGRPVSWHRNPSTGLSWDDQLSWTAALADQSPGDIKDCWEIARFPHAYTCARAAAHHDDLTEILAQELLAQMRHFVASNPVGMGIHWASGQETAFRLLAWIFAYSALLARSSVANAAADLIEIALEVGVLHIARHFDYARLAVYNNHLLSEALGLYAAGVLLPGAGEAPRWRETGFRTLTAEADKQFYADGGYIQQSHNYHRLAVQNYLWANVFRRAEGGDMPAAWRGALQRSVDFLWAHQNPGDGRLPNYGANDGALPAILSSCDFSDMRPTMQAASILASGERLYAPGPWDEEAAWFLGPASLNAPLRKGRRRSVSFADTGYHVLRGDDESTYASFRCGTLRDRFSQIDMLHLDVWWKGENVLADPGSYRYNAAPTWHAHFMSTASHNTVTVDSHNQMIHFRQFKVLYWTKARLLRFEDNADWTLAEGEHYGFRRLPGRCVHRRAVLHAKDGLWVVCDEVTGVGRHDVRVNWLGGNYVWSEPETKNGMTLTTPKGPFDVRLFDEAGEPLASDVVAGGDNPHRGWLSRYYGEKIPVPSLAAARTGEMPLTCISVLSGGPITVKCVSGAWAIQTSSNLLRFRLDRARFLDVQIDR